MQSKLRPLMLKDPKETRLELNNDEYDAFTG
jgi:hypothetical protein